MRKLLPSLEDFEIGYGALEREESKWLREMFIMRTIYVLGMICLWKGDEEI